MTVAALVSDCEPMLMTAVRVAVVVVAVAVVEAVVVVVVAPEAEDTEDGWLEATVRDASVEPAGEAVYCLPRHFLGDTAAGAGETWTGSLSSPGGSSVDGGGSP